MLKVIFNDNLIDVYFYLYEKSSFYGNDVIPKETANQGFYLLITIDNNFKLLLLYNFIFKINFSVKML